METTETIHPKHAQALAAAKLAREMKENLLQDCRDTTAFYGLRFTHVRPSEYQSGMTIAYRQVKRNIFEVATALRNPKDSFSRDLGRAYAAQNFARQKTILLRIPDYATRSAGEYLQETLSPTILYLDR